MTGTRVPEPMGGFGIPSAVISLATLVPVPSGTPGTFDSNFTQAGPAPGTARAQDADSKLQPFLTNAQETDVVVEVTQAGGANREGCAVSYRKKSEADTEFRGWIPPTWITGWTAAAFTDAETFDMFQAAVIPSTQEVIVVAKTLSDGSPVSRLWSPSTRSWGAATDILAGSGIAAGNHAAVAVLPDSELILAMVGVRGTIFSSKDKGATWQLYSLEPLGVTLTLPATLKRDRMAVTPNGELVLFHATSTASENAQFASSDRGATWDEVETGTALGTGIDVTALPDGSIGVVFGGSFARLASPFDLASDAPTIPITSGAERAIWSDFDGVLYVMVREVATSRRLVLQRSKDSGTTWEDFAFNPWAQATAPAATAVGPENLQAIPVEGGAMLLHNWAGTGGLFNGSIGALQIGGWSNVLGGVASGGNLIIDRAAWGGDGVGSGATWVPIDLPENMGYTLTGTAPTLIAASLGELEFLTVAAQGSEEFVLATQANIVAMGELRVRLGGALTTNEVGFRLIASDGVNNSFVEINFDGTGFRVRDVVAGTDLATVAIDITSNDDLTDMVQVKAQIVGHTTLRVFFKRSNVNNWTSVTLTTSTLAFTGVLPNGRAVFGHRIASTSTSRWRQFHVVTGGIALLRIADTNLLIGKAPSGVPVPIVDIGQALGGTLYSFMGLESGPGTVGERYDIATFYKFGIDKIFADVEPSPDAGWRATDETEQILVWDLGRDTILGKSIFNLLMRVQQRLCEVAYAADGAGSFTVLDTFDSGAEFTGLGYVRSGDSVRPLPGFTTADRYLFEEEATGGHLVMVAAVPSTAREILECRAGHWLGTVRPELRVDIQGGEPAANDCTIVLPDGVLISHTAGIRARYVRLRFPAQPTPHGYIGAGLIIPMGTVQPMGQLHEWDWGSETSLNRDDRTSPYGTSRFRELGPPPTDWNDNHTSGLDQTNLRQSAADDINYQAPSADLAGLAALNDVWLLQRGIAQRLKSGEIACLSLPAIPDASGETLTDRSLWTYGRISGAVRADGVVGDEGVDELVRVLGFGVGEIR